MLLLASTRTNLVILRRRSTIIIKLDESYDASSRGQARDELAVSRRAAAEDGMRRDDLP